ncbi:MAG TPA: DUF4892 domain-containing protein [Marinobacterium sp.]|nr:DUF4892 domain-containing protein [Marinobacterium sp.]
MLRALTAIVLLLPAMLAQALSMPDLPDGLTNYDLSKPDRFRTGEVSDYRLVLGSVVKIDRQLRAGAELRLGGELKQFTWEIARSHEPEEAFDDLRTQLSERGANLLYQCSGRECGASNIWANDIFRYSTLYGRDDSQRYMAAELNGNHYALYAVRRGNQRVYLHLDLIVGENALANAWYAPLETQGYMVLPHWPDSPELAIKELVAWLDTNRLTVQLVVHQEGRDTALAMSESEAHAVNLRRQLIASGVEARRIEAFGVGNLVPSVLGSNQQLVVVVAR